MYYQNDGCLLHSSRVVYDWLTEKFVEKWMGRKSSILWAYLRIMYFDLWGRLKQMVYEGPLNNDEEQLNGRIIKEMWSMPVEGGIQISNWKLCWLGFIWINVFHYEIMSNFFYKNINKKLTVTVKSQMKCILVVWKHFIGKKVKFCVKIKIQKCSSRK